MKCTWTLRFKSATTFVGQLARSHYVFATGSMVFPKLFLQSFKITLTWCSGGGGGGGTCKDIRSELCSTVDAWKMSGGNNQNSVTVSHGQACHTIMFVSASDTDV